MAAAVAEFGARGFEATSTRQIASAAGLNTPALQYYFNNKEGLYSHCAEIIIEEAWTGMKDLVIATEKILAGRADSARLIEAYCSLQDRFADSLADGGGHWLRWMSHEYSGVGANFSFVSDHPRSKRMSHVTRAIVARLLGRPLRDPASILHHMLVGGHPVHFYLLCRRAAAALGWTTIGAGRLLLIKQLSRRHSVASLRAIIDLRKRG